MTPRQVGISASMSSEVTISRLSGFALSCYVYLFRGVPDSTYFGRVDERSHPANSDVRSLLMPQYAAHP
jgi:hypothetical protein